MSAQAIHNELMDILQCLFLFEYTDGNGKLNEYTSRYSCQPLDLRQDEFWGDFVENMLFQQFYGRGDFWEYYNRRYRLTISKDDYIRYFKEQTDIQRNLVDKKYDYVYEGYSLKRDIGLFITYNYESDFKTELRTWAENEFLEEYMIMPK